MIGMMKPTSQQREKYFQFLGQVQLNLEIKKEKLLLASPLLWWLCWFSFFRPAINLVMLMEIRWASVYGTEDLEIYRAHDGSWMVCGARGGAGRSVGSR